MRVLRRVVFYGCLAAYAVSCPLVVLYVLGYELTPGAESGVTKTGVLVLDSLPAGASVYLEGRRYTNTTPTMLSGLLPGRYAVKVLLRHYRPWGRQVAIEAGKATVFDKLLLLPTPLVYRPVVADSFEDLAPLSDDGLLLARGPRAGELATYSWKEQAFRPLLGDHEEWRDARVLSHTIVPDSPWVLLQVRAEGQEHVLWIQTDRPRARVVELTTLFSDRPSWIEWDARHPSVLFSLHEHAVNRIDAHAMAVYPRILESVRSIGINGQTIYALTQDNVLAQFDRDGQLLEVLFDDPAVRQLFADMSGPCRIHVLSRDVVAVLGPQGQLWVSRFPEELMATKVRGIEFDPAREQLLIWQKDRVGILDCAGEPVLRWVFDQGRDLQQAFWAHAGSHLVLRDGRTVWLVGLQSAGDEAPQELVQVRPGSSIAYAEDVGGVFYVDPLTGALSYVNLVPTKDLSEPRA